MSTDPTPPYPLYDQIEAAIARHSTVDLMSILDHPLFQVESTDLPSMAWTPKAMCAGVFAEDVGDDPILGVERARFSSASTIYLRFRLKQKHDGPVRCVVVLNGRHSIRFAIGRGKVERRRSYAEVLLKLDQFAMTSGQGLDLEIFRDARMLYHSRILARPTSVPGWIQHWGLMASRLFSVPFVSTWRLRPVRVPATRLLEESFRIKAK